MNVGRATTYWWANTVVIGYLVATVVMAIGHAFGAESTWLLVHLLLLGAVTNAIVIWSGHFATTLLHPDDARAGRLLLPLLALNGSVAAILVGGAERLPVVTVAAGSLLAATIAWRGDMLARAVRTARNARFAVTVRFYWVASVALIVGIAAGIAVSVGVSAPWHARLVAVHLHANLFGWIALTVLGTNVSFWPMVLRTRVVEGAEQAAGRALLLCAGGLALALAGFVCASRVVAVIGVASYLVGVLCGVGPFVRTAARRTPRGGAALMLAAATGWLLVGLGADLTAVVRSTEPAMVDRLEGMAPWLAVGFAAQAVLGALTYLLPAILGRGPAGVRRATSLLDRWGSARTVTFNAGVGLVALPLPSGASAVGWSLVLASTVAFVGLASGAFVITRPGAVSPEPARRRGEPS